LPDFCYKGRVNLILFAAEEVGPEGVLLKKKDPRAEHLVKVLRKKPGDDFDAGLLGGNIGTGRLRAVNADGTLCCDLHLPSPPPPRLPLRVAVGFPRPIQLRRLLRDLSNLGVAAIDLLATDRGEKSYRDTTLLTDGGARAALIEGAAQARDTLLPLLATWPSLDAWLAARPWSDPAATAGADAAILLAAPDNVDPQGSFSALKTGAAAAVIAVGAERGWSDRERAGLESAGFLRLSMGSRALRTETACVAATVLGMEKIGLLR